MASLASERWAILRKAIISLRNRSSQATEKATDLVSNASVRNFSSFNLFDVVVDSGQWVRYSYSTENDCVHVEARVKILDARVSLEAMMGFNNTGNVCVWPAEEVLAYYCLENKKIFKGASVCELGCGMTGLAGVMLACSTTPYNVLLTDGNERSVCNVREIVDGNRERFGVTKVSCDILRWESSTISEKYCGKFDYVICADCLFFLNLHNELALVIQKLLKPNGGMALIFAPRRGNTLEHFCSIVKDYFQVEFSEHYSDIVSSVHRQNPENYNPDLHYPLKIVLKR